MEPNLSSSALPLSPGPSGANSGKAPEPASLPPEEAFGTVIRSALEKKNPQSYGKSVDPSLLAIIGYLMASPSNPNMLGETLTEGQNADPTESAETTGPSSIVPAPSSANENPFQNGIELQPFGEGTGNTILSHPLNDVPHGDLLSLRGALSVDSSKAPSGTGSLSSNQKTDPLPADLLDPSAITKGSVSTQMSTGTGAPSSGEGNENPIFSRLLIDIAAPDLLSPKGGLSIVSREASSEIDFPSFDHGSDASPTDSLNPLTADGRLESTQTGTGLLKQNGTDILWNGGTRETVYGPPLQNGSSPERTATLGQNVVSLSNSGESLTPQENMNPFVNGGSSAFERMERELLRTGGTEKMTIEEGSLPCPAQKENKPGLESFPSPLAPEHPASTFASREAGNGPLPSPPKTEFPEIHEQVEKQVLWSLKNNEEKIRLVLEPPELGSIYMEIKREKDLVKATLWTDNSATREILESHQVQLHNLLKADGFSLEKFDVFMQQGMGWFQERREKPVDPGPWSHGEPTGEGKPHGSVSPDAAPVQATLSAQGSQHVDIFI